MILQSLKNFAIIMIVAVTGCETGRHVVIVEAEPWVIKSWDCNDPTCTPGKPCEPCRRKIKGLKW